MGPADHIGDVKAAEPESPSTRPRAKRQLTNVPCNEEREARVFDRLAERVDRAALKVSDWTLRRYRNAVLGRPVFDNYPDLVFQTVGQLVAPCPDVAKPLASLHVLDLGAGDGEWSVIFADQGARVASVELSPNQVAVARERMTINNLRWDAQIESAYRLTARFPAASFDLVFGQGILHHLTTDLGAAFSGISHVLRPGGHAVFSEPFSASRRVRALRERLSWLLPLDAETPDERPLTTADLSRMLPHFSRVDVIRYDVLAKFGRRLLGSDDAVRRLARVDTLLLKCPPLATLATAVFINATK